MLSAFQVTLVISDIKNGDIELLCQMKQNFLVPTVRFRSTEETKWYHQDLRYDLACASQSFQYR